MGMQNLPKFAALGAPDVEGDELSINVRYFTAFGDMHYALAMTAGMCIGGACRTKGTIAEKFVKKGGAAGSQSEIKIGHPSGVASFVIEKNGGVPVAASYERTVRPILQGTAFYPLI